MASLLSKKQNLLNSSPVSYRFPPAQLTANTTTISGQSYGNGTYIVTSSSATSAPGKDIYFIFNYNLSDYWSTYNNKYTSGTGIYKGTTTTTASGIVCSGEWVQIDYNLKFCATYIVIKGVISSIPTKFCFVASNDNINWTMLINQTTEIIPAINYNVQDVPFTFTNTIFYRYYRLIGTKVAGDIEFGFRELYIYGYDDVLNRQTYIGIGTTNPAEKLEVNENIRCSGKYICSTTTGAPATGISGGIGDRIILYPGTTTPTATYPYSIGINSSVLWYNTPSGANHSFCCNGTEKIRIEANTITLNGTVNASITGSSASCTGNAASSSTAYAISSSDSTIGGVRLVSSVYGANIYMNGWHFWNFAMSGWGDVLGISTPTDYRFCFPATTGPGSVNLSDERIKHNIALIDITSINFFLQLKAKAYEYCRDKTKNKRFGFVAQEILKTDLHYLVIDNQSNFIANIYEYVTCKNKVITTNKSISNLLKEGDEIKILLDNIDEKEKIINEKNNKCKKRYAKILKIISENQFEIDNDIYENIKPETESPLTNFFVYGTKVNDFKSVDYKSIFSLNVAVTQELYKIIQEQKQQLEKQNTIIEDLKQRMERLESKLN